MVQNLNQMNFKQFGTILPERGPSEPRGEKCPVPADNAPICRSAGPVWLSSGSGMTVLSVRRAGEQTLQHFYLDKPVCLGAGVEFCLSTFRREPSSAYLKSEAVLENMGEVYKIQDFRLKRELFVSNIYTFFYQEKEKGFFFPGEAHPMLELTYVDQGSLHSVADGQDLLLQQGELAIYGPNQWHVQYADMDVSASFITVTFDLEGDRWQQLLNRKCQIPRQAVGILQQLLRERERADEYSTDIIISQLTLLLLTILRYGGQSAERLQPSNSVHAENALILRSQQYISAHIRQKLSVPLVAQAVGVSPSYLTALFHKNLQISPGEYIRRIKLQESKQMIREGSMNFTEIAAALQYSTVHHFSRQFKEKFGITPSEYARSVR